MEALAIEQLVIQWLAIIGGVGAVWWRGRQYTQQVTDIARWRENVDQQLARASEHRSDSNKAHQSIETKMDAMREDIHDLDLKVVQIAERMDVWMKQNGRR